MARVPPSLDSATIDGPAPLRHTPRIAGSSNAMASARPGTSARAPAGAIDPSSPLAGRRSGPTRSASTNSNARCRLKIASASGTASGRTCRACGRMQPHVGRRDDELHGLRPLRRARDDAAVVALTAHRHAAEERRRSIVRMPFELRCHRAASPRRGRGLVIASYSRRPATAAAALLPRPAVCGISLVTRTRSPGDGVPISCRARR